MELQGQVAIVTGGGRGIGRATAQWARISSWPSWIGLTPKILRRNCVALAVARLWCRRMSRPAMISGRWSSGHSPSLAGLIPL